jgi:hypothetical protein
MSLSNLTKRIYGVPGWVCYVVVFCVGLLIGSILL